MVTFQINLLSQGFKKTEKEKERKFRTGLSGPKQGMVINFLYVQNLYLLYIMNNLLDSALEE